MVWLRFALWLSLLSATPALAAPRWERWSLDLGCPPFATCASMTLTSTVHANGTSVIALTYRNGRNVYGNLFHERQLYTYFDVESNFIGAGWYASGRVRTVSPEPDGAPLGLPDIWVGYSGRDAHEVPRYGLFMTNGSAPVMGCFSGPPSFVGSSGLSYYSICGQAGFGGTVTIFWQFRNRLTLHDLHADGLWEGTEPSICAPPARCVYSVAPEPSTWLLLATGLAAFGGVAALKRRRVPDQR